MANDAIKAMRERSGHITLSDPLVGLFYDLLRDHMPAGALESLVQLACVNAPKSILYTNGWLALYAQDMVRRLDEARSKRAEAETVLSNQPPVQGDT